jgi:D-glycero-D-manno-heptose 1,7-bisphosphate phosphatase
MRQGDPHRTDRGNLLLLDSIIYRMLPAIFLDRDGVIIENRPQYVRSWLDVQIFPQALQALNRLKDTPFKIVIVTNQAGVSRGVISISVAEEINRRLGEAVERAGGRIDGIFMCPHKPEDGCNCRKPRPGLIEQAARELAIDLSQSLLVGDMLTDLLAGKAAGIPRLVLVRTGLGAQQIESAPVGILDSFLVFDSLSEALNQLVFNPPNPPLGTAGPARNSSGSTLPLQDPP